MGKNVEPHEISYSVGSAVECGKRIMRGNIRVEAGLNYLNGSLVVVIDYDLRGEYASCKIKPFICHDQYAESVGSGDSLDWAKYSPTIHPDDGVRKSIALVLEYAYFVNQHVERERTPPPRLAEFIKMKQQPSVGGARQFSSFHEG